MQENRIPSPSLNCLMILSQKKLPIDRIKAVILELITLRAIITQLRGTRANSWPTRQGKLGAKVSPCSVWALAPDRG